MSTTNRRKFLGRGAVAAAAATAAAVPKAQAQEKPTKRVIYRNGRGAPAPGSKPRMSSTVAYGNLIFISGVGYHQAGDIKVHTKAVLDSIKAQLEAAGSSMEKVVKCNVYLNDLKDYAAMKANLFPGDPPDFDAVLKSVEGFAQRFNGK